MIWKYQSDHKHRWNSINQNKEVAEQLLEILLFFILLLNFLMLDFY